MLLSTEALKQGETPATKSTRMRKHDVREIKTCCSECRSIAVEIQFFVVSNSQIVYI